MPRSINFDKKQAIEDNQRSIKMTRSIKLDKKQAIEDNQRTTRINRIHWCTLNSRAVIAELFATASLIFFGCMTCTPIPGMENFPPALGFGLVVIFNIQIFGHISGAHMNPAVTLSSVIWGSTSVPLGVAYVVAQCVGAILGYYVLSVLAPVDVVVEGTCVTALREGLSVYQAIGIEALLTSAMCLLCCGLWDPTNQPQQGSAAVMFGLAVAGLSLVTGHLTGCSMNPARSLGPALLTGRWTHHYVYWVAPLVGGALGTTVYKFLLLKPLNKAIFSDFLD